MARSPQAEISAQHIRTQAVQRDVLAAEFAFAMTGKNGVPEEKRTSEVGQ